MINAVELLAAHAARTAGGKSGAPLLSAVRPPEVSEAEAAKPEITYARAPAASSGQSIGGRPHAVQVNSR